MEPGSVPQGKLRSGVNSLSDRLPDALQAGNTTAQALQAWQKVLAQWESLENAKERTFKYWLYR